MGKDVLPLSVSVPPTDVSSSPRFVQHTVPGPWAMSDPTTFISEWRSGSGRRDLARARRVSELCHLNTRVVTKKRTYQISTSSDRPSDGTGWKLTRRTDVPSWSALTNQDTHHGSWLTTAFSEIAWKNTLS